VSVARTVGASAMELDAEPKAIGFYERIGGRCCVSRSQAEVKRPLGPVSDHEGQFVEGFGRRCCVGGSQFVAEPSALARSQMT
jgi:hypothetical protein